MKTQTHGGARKGAGRKPKEIETTTVSFRVPIDKVDSLKVYVRKFLKKFEVKKKNKNVQQS